MLDGNPIRKNLFTALKISLPSFSKFSLIITLNLPKNMLFDENSCNCTVIQI